MSEDDIVDLVAGKTVYGIKLNKNFRRELKFAIKRETKTDVIEAMITDYIYGSNAHEKKLGMKNKNQNI